MTLEQLDFFLAAVEYDTFFDAAESLHTTQSTLSKQIKKLEQELSLTLFDRSHRSAFLTEDGNFFYPKAKETAQQYHVMLSHVQEYQKKKHTLLKAGTLPILAQYQLSGIFKEFCSKTPNISVSVEEAEEKELLNGLESRALDLIIARSLSADINRHHFIPLAEDRLSAILPQNHALADRSSLSLEDLSNENFIMMHSFTSLYHLCIHMFEKAGIKPNIIRTARMESILGAVSAGEGISLFAEKNFRMFHHQQLVSVPLDAAPKLYVGVITLCSNNSPYVAQFLNFVRNSPYSLLSEPYLRML